jgi:hypothetical protein
MVGEPRLPRIACCRLPPAPQRCPLAGLLYCPARPQRVSGISELRKVNARPAIHNNNTRQPRPAATLSMMNTNATVRERSTPDTPRPAPPRPAPDPRRGSLRYPAVPAAIGT